MPTVVAQRQARLPFGGRWLAILQLGRSQLPGKRWTLSLSSSAIVWQFVALFPLHVREIIGRVSALRSQKSFLIGVTSLLLHTVMLMQPLKCTTNTAYQTVSHSRAIHRQRTRPQEVRALEPCGCVPAAIASFSLRPYYRSTTPA